MHVGLLVPAWRSCPVIENARRRGSTLVEDLVLESINTGLPTKDVICIQGLGREIYLRENKDFRSPRLRANPQMR